MDFWIAASYLKAPALPTLVVCLRVFVSPPCQSRTKRTVLHITRYVATLGAVFVAGHDVRCAAAACKMFYQNACQLCGTPCPLRRLDIIRPSGWSNIGAVNPFNVISLLAQELTPPVSQ